MDINSIIFDTIIEKITSKLKDTDYKSTEILNERDFYINTFKDSQHILAVRFNKGRGIVSVKFQKIDGLLYKTWDFGLSRADSLAEISEFVGKLIKNPEEHLGTFINSFTGEYHFLANDFPHEITWRSKKYASVQEGFDKLGTYVVGENVKAKDYLLMISLMKRKFADKDLKKKLFDTDKAVLVNECKDPVWGMIAGYGTNLLGELLAIFRSKGIDGYVKNFKAHLKFEKLSKGQPA